MDRKSASGTLRQISRLLEVAGENPHRVRAFSGAARAVDAVHGDLAELVAGGEILKLRGVGKGTAAVLEELVAGNRPRALVEAEEKVPSGVRDMLDLPGLGPKKVRTLWRDLGAESLGELEYACRENRLVDLKGFGPATQDSLLKALELHQDWRKRRLLHRAWAESDVRSSALEAAPDVRTAEVVGELRRSCETIGELVFVVGLREGGCPESVARVLGDVERVDRGQWLVRPTNGLPVRLWFAREGSRGVATIRATGGEGFVAALDARANELGLVFTDRDLRRNGKSIEAGEEDGVFAALELGWVAPELRDDRRWVADAVRGSLPELVDFQDLGGALHNHTTDSDGLATLEEMAGAALSRGWGFFGVADHSPAATYANGVDADRLRAQWARADAWNSANPELRIVKGLEADILADGGLDIPPGCEAGLEYVVASVHSSFKLPRETQTERLVAAVTHPACRILGHPTGRLLLGRPGYEVDLDRVLDACREHDVAVEINASPYRLDLDWRWVTEAVKRGIALVINPDAHSVEGLDNLRWGLAVARKGGATKNDLVNCHDIDEFLNR